MLKSTAMSSMSEMEMNEMGIPAKLDLVLIVLKIFNKISKSS